MALTRPLKAENFVGFSVETVAIFLFGWVAWYYVRVWESGEVCVCCV